MEADLDAVPGYCTAPRPGVISSTTRHITHQGRRDRQPPFVGGDTLGVSFDFIAPQEW